MNRRPVRSILAPLALAAAAGIACPVAHAQYKVVGPDGKVTYTDRPDTAPAAAKVSPVRGASAAAAGAAAGPALPYALQQTAARYPVTLYTRQDCGPCDDGRALLRQRGVPFTEKTVTTSDDAAAFQRLEASGELPVLRIGSQQLRGLSASDWNAYLDAAGYPKTSLLPPGYRAPEPAPLVTAAAKPTPAPAPARPVAPTPPVAPPPADNAASGIRF